MAAVTVKVEGQRELDRALGQLPKATGKAVLRRTLLKAGKPIADAARGMAPDDPETGGNDLRSSIGVGTQLSERQKKLHKKMFKSDKASAEAFAGAGKVPHAHLQEFGTVNHGPQAFMRPAWDSQQGKALDIVKSELGNEIMKAAKRLAKKAAKG
jgi:HK97 gp10 family phage protein